MSNRLLLYKYKGNTCQYCGTTVEEKLRAFRSYACFELHHIDPSKKSPEYDNLIRRKLSSEQLDEVDKCALLCGNCHDTLHGQDLTLPVQFTLKANGIEPIVHVLTCQIIFDYDKSEATVFSDDLKFLDLYRVQVGTDPALIMSGLQLKPILDSLVERTRTDGSLVVSSMDDAPMYQALRLTDTDVQCVWRSDFPLPAAELRFRTEAGDVMNIFLRNGHLIVDTGKTYIRQTAAQGTLKFVKKYQTTTEADEV